MTMKPSGIKTAVDLKIIDGDEIISVNDRARLKDIKKNYPNLEVIIGKVEDDDKPISIDLAEMEASKIKIIDAATESTLGKRVDRLHREPHFPLSGVMFLIGFLGGVAATFFVYNI